MGTYFVIRNGSSIIILSEELSHVQNCLLYKKLLVECWSLVKYNDNANLKFDANIRVQNDVQFVSKIVVIV
jgi:hypothetical protein